MAADRNSARVIRLRYDSDLHDTIPQERDTHTHKTHTYDTHSLSNGWHTHKASTQERERAWVCVRVWNSLGHHSRLYDISPHTRIQTRARAHTHTHTHTAVQPVQGTHPRINVSSHATLNKYRCMSLVFALICGAHGLSAWEEQVSLNWLHTHYISITDSATFSAGTRRELPAYMMWGRWFLPHLPCTCVHMHLNKAYR